jgi:hypothetical protein
VHGTADDAPSTVVRKLAVDACERSAEAAAAARAVFLKKNCVKLLPLSASRPRWGTRTRPTKRPRWPPFRNRCRFDWCSRRFCWRQRRCGVGYCPRRPRCRSSAAAVPTSPRPPRTGGRCTRWRPRKAAVMPTLMPRRRPLALPGWRRCYLASKQAPA